MNWSIIYSFDLHNEQAGNIKRFKPQAGEWIVTEDDDQFEGYGDIEEGIHRKYVAFLSDEEFRLFVDDILMPDFVDNTMGMLGGMTPDGMSLGMMPAWSLSPETSEAIWQNAYVCPFPEDDEEEAFLKGSTDQDIANWIHHEYVR